MRKLKGNPFVKNREVMDILTGYPKFLEKVKQLRVAFNIKNDGFSENEDLENWYENLLVYKAKIQLFNEAVNLVLKDFNLASNFKPSIEMYLLTNKIIAPDSIYISVNQNEDLSQNELKVQVFGETREEDWRRAWHLINKLQKRLPGYKAGRYRETTNLRAEKEAYLLKSKSRNEIRKILANRKLGFNLDVEKLIYNFKTRFARFKKK